MQQPPQPSNPVIHLAVLIDDDNMDNFMHQRVLEKSGFVEQVVAFDHAEEALTFVTSESSQIDMIFVDINMPRMDGYAFLDAFQKLNTASDSTPLIVLLSTSISPEDVQRVGDYNADVRTEEKPLSAEKLKRIFADDRA